MGGMRKACYLCQVGMMFQQRMCRLFCMALDVRFKGSLSAWCELLCQRCQMTPPLWGDENSHQPVKGLCIAPRARTSWYVICLEPSWALLPLEPRVRPLVGHFGLASIGTERTPHRPAYIIG